MTDISILVSDLLDTFYRGEGSGRLDQRHDDGVCDTDMWGMSPGVFIPDGIIKLSSPILYQPQNKSYNE